MSNSAALSAGPRPAPRYVEDVIRAAMVLTMFWGIAAFLGRRRDRRPARLAATELRQRAPDLRPPAPAPHLGGDLRLRRHRADRHRLPCRAAHLPRPPVRRRAARLVRAAGLPVLHRRRGDRLPARHHPEQGIRRARMVRRPVADDRLGGLPDRLSRHGAEARGAAHLRRQLVLSRLHHHHRDAAHRQQPRDAGVLRRHQELRRLVGRAGRDDPVVVRPQRGRLLPDRGLPRR